MRKMRQLFLFTISLFMIMLSACSSPETKEVLSYHNDLVENVYPKIDEVLKVNDKLMTVSSEEEALDMQRNEIIPLMKEIKNYVESIEPKEDITKEYHQIKVEWINALNEAAEIDAETLEAFINDSMSDEEIMELSQKAEEKGQQAVELDSKASEKWVEIKEEYNIEDVEE